MALEAERGPIGARDALKAAIEQRHVRDANVCRQRRRIHGEPVILARDDDLPGVLVEHRMIGAVMAEFHLQRLRTRCKTQQLMAKAYAERRLTGIDELADRAYRVVTRFGIARTVRQEDAVGTQCEGIGRGRSCRHDSERAAALREEPQDVVLRAVVVSDDAKARVTRRAISMTERPRAAAPFVR